jgi:hypothetical protein
MTYVVDKSNAYSYNVEIRNVLFLPEVAPGC